MVVIKSKRNFSANICKFLNPATKIHGTDNVLEGFTQLTHLLKHICCY